MIYIYVNLYPSILEIFYTLFSIVGLDYNAVSQGLIFSSGAAVGNALGRRCFFVQTIEDGINEPTPNPELLGLTLTSTNTLLTIQAGRGTATVNILDDDPRMHWSLTAWFTINIDSHLA